MIPTKAISRGLYHQGIPEFTKLIEAQDKVELMLTPMVMNSIKNSIKLITNYKLMDTLITTLWHWLATLLPTRYSQKPESLSWSTLIETPNSHTV